MSHLALGEHDKFFWPYYIGYLDLIFKTKHRGHGSRLDPYQEQGSPNTHDCGWGCHFKSPFLESDEVLGKDLEFSNCHPEEGVPLFLLWEKREVIQVKICPISHTQDAAVQEIYSQG
jgi:hypothetical protein